jgi:hypothetical protein
MEKIIQFFNFELPCPNEIPECERLRVEYTDNLNNLRRQGGCGACTENKIKNEFILKLQKLISVNN